jgi:hypothetical protein
MKRFIVWSSEDFGRSELRTGGGGYMVRLIRTVTFTQQKTKISEPNQLPKWLKSTRTKIEQDCGPRFRYNPGEATEALWIKAERACRMKAKG